MAQSGEGPTGSTSAATLFTGSETMASEGDSLGETSNDVTSGEAPQCGNGIVEHGEHCDSQPFAGHACPDTCRFPERLELWIARVDIDGGADRGFDLSVGEGDDVGMIAVVGESSPGGPEAGNVLVAAVTGTGEVTCAKGHAAGAGTTEYAEAAMASGGRIVAAGHQRDEVWIGEFSGTCERVWDLSLAGENPASTYWASSVLAMNDGGLLVTATGDLPEPLPGYLIALTARGTDPVVQQIAGAIDTGGNSMLADLHGALLPSGDLVLLATTFAEAQLRGWLQRRSVSGAVVWEHSFAGPDPDGYVRVADLVVDGSGDVLVTADWPTGTDEGTDIMVRRYSVDGRELWTSIYSGPMGLTDQAGGVAVDELGNVYMHGLSEMGPADHDMVARKLSPGGDVVWTELWTGPDSEPFNHDYGSAVEVDARGLIVLLGYTYAQQTDYDVLIRLVAP